MGRGSVAFGLLVILASEGGAQPPSWFHRVPVRGDFVTYFNLAVWLEGEERLFVNHPRSQSFVVVERDGTLNPAVKVPFPQDAGNPIWWSGVEASDGQTLLYFRDAWARFARAAKLESQGRLGQSEPLETWLAPTVGKLAGVIGPVVSFGSHRCGYIQVQVGDATKFRFGVACFGKPPAAPVRWYREPPVNSTDIMMLFARPLLTSTAKGVFLLEYHGGPRVVRLLPEEKKLESFPPGFISPPPVPPNLSGPDGAWAFNEGVETNPVPVGLFAFGGDLFILTRTPKGANKALWQLHRLDPENDRLTGTLELPTEAPGIVLVPGKTRWAVLELGPAAPLLERKLLALGEFPASVLASLPRPGSEKVTTGP